MQLPITLNKYLVIQLIMYVIKTLIYGAYFK